ncbi:TonB-dependent receptor [uncultured Mucilaginibacter sp.]|uniref:TonB-dependent receptor n=1 Tax=uncultured Mucilaginibacter sp. TaxID=797541 RepID=UPI0025FB151C|nr:TonB-dependent receptor [uncultured Mucilaginibacter sp.]
MVAKFYLLSFFILFSASVFAQNASISGRVADKNNNEPLAGAVVYLDGSKNSSVVNDKGEYALLNVSPGKHQVVVKYISYLDHSENVTLSSGQALVLNMKLHQNTQNLNEVNVHGRLLTENEAAARANEKNSDNVKNVISAQAIAKSPDINAANVLQRVSGVTIQRNAGGDDAFAIIRGLEPRYNNTLINGIQIASPSSKTRLVSLSVVPSDLLARIEVDKTLTPEMEGDAIGGTVNMVFKDAPDKREISATSSIGYEQLFLDRKFVDFSKKDIHTYSPSETNEANYIAQPGDFTRSNLDFKNIQAPPSETFTLSFGERFLNNKLGLIIGNSYQNNYFGSNTEGNIGNADPNDPDRRPVINDIYNRAISSRQILNNLIAHLDYKINDRNKIVFDNVFLYSRIEEALFNADTSIRGGNGGRTISGTGPVSITRQSTVTSQYIENIKLSGNHVLGEHLSFDWYGAFSDAFVRTPDQAAISSNILIAYDPATGFTKTPEFFDEIDRTWAHNNDKDFDGAGKITYKTKIKNALLEIKAGGLYRHKSRYNYEDEYILKNVADANGGKPAFTNIYTLQWSVYNVYGAGAYNVNNYTATEDVGAYYGMAKVSFPKLELLGGVRAETTSQDIHVLQDITNASEITKNYTDLLPSVNIKYKVSEKANLRLAYYASIARPAYFELVPTGSTGASNGVSTLGNPALKHTTANNYDFRYEIFPKADEQFFIGTYYKQLTNPIEFAYVGGNSSVIMPINTGSAKVAGVELGYTKFIGNYGISGNYAYNYSDVTDNKKINRLNPTQDTIEHRMLSGASVHDLNVSLLYRNKKTGLNAQLAFQYLGKTLVGRYPDNGDNYIQQPLSSLAFSADKSIGKHFTIFTKLNNLLNTHTTVVLHNFQNGNEITKATYLVGARYNY